MNHFPFHVGDWVKDTAHLNPCEEGIYLRLMVQYYNRETVLPADLSACVKLARATTAEQREAVKYCLTEFFQKTTDGYRHKRCDQEIAAYQERAAQAREAGRRGGRPAKSLSNVPRGPEPGRLFPETVTVSTENRDGSGQKPEAFLQETGSKASRKPLAIGEEVKKPPAGGTDQDTTIWTVGVRLLVGAGSSEANARTFLGQYAKGGRAPKLAEVIGRMSLHPVADPKSYIAAAMREAGDGLPTLSASELAS
jgi:uncharacterized protein YdaU (DUF1376 family)